MPIKGTTRPYIITISGKAGCGKDTAAIILKNKIIQNSNKKVVIVHYSDLLKFICKQYFNWNGKKDIKGRKLLQYIGTDIVRSRQPDFWIQMLYEIINIIFVEYDIVIIADARFKNEIDFWKDRKLLISSILIKRLNFKNKKMNEKTNQHISENDVNNY